MYIKSIDIENIRSIEHFHWELDKPDEELAGWHVLIGDNGSGKSTILKAVALALVGEYEVQALRENWDEWVSEGQERGKIELIIIPDKPDSPQPEIYQMGDNEPITVLIDHDTIRPHFNFSFARSAFDKIGFSAAYGPYRRFEGNDSTRKLWSSAPRLMAHLSIFSADVALIDVLKWLQDLHYRRLDNKQDGEILDKIIHFVNQEGFLPNQTEMVSISSEGVFFKNAHGRAIFIENLGDGYRSILSMVFDVIRHMQIAYRTDELFSEDGTKIIRSGVVLIDEVDAHLHPEWQRTIGYWLTDHFPKIQFIVTTHSPLVCQAAVRGSIWRLPAPGSDEKAHQITPDSEDWKRLVYGDILEAYSTDLFGENINRSPEAQAMFEELGQLSAKEMEAPLSPEEEKRLNELENELPSTPYKDTVGGGYD